MVMATGQGKATTFSLIPIKELSPGAVGAIRNQVIDAVVAQVCKALNKTPGDLVVRDVRPFSDLAMYSVVATLSAVNDWAYTATTTVANAWTNLTANPTTMGDQRWVALFGVRDNRYSLSVHASSTAGALAGVLQPDVGMVKIIVGGSDKVIWDIEGLWAYRDNMVGFSPSAVIIPQNTAYAIQYQRINTLTEQASRIQLIGVVVEPRGLVVTP